VGVGVGAGVPEARADELAYRIGRRHVLAMVRRFVALAVALSGCGARTEGPLPTSVDEARVCIARTIAAPVAGDAASECALIAGACPTETCFQDRVQITSCAGDCEYSSAFGCFAKDRVTFVRTCAVRESTGEIYRWSVARPMPPGFRACRAEETGADVDTLEEKRTCTIAAH
jgi:hypothetical protein